VKPIGLGARDSLRLEAGLPLYGHDLDEETTPVEADLGFAISKRRRAEGGFPGAQRIGASWNRADPPPRRPAVEGRQPVREGAMVVDGEGNEVGKVTSGGFSPMLEAPIAMAYVPAAMAEPGTRSRSPSAARSSRRRSCRCPSSPTATTAREPPNEPLFTKEHEWIRVEGDTATVGITDFAQGQLGDIVFVEVPEAGRRSSKGGEAAVVESVKAASDVYAPVSGEVTRATRRWRRSRRWSTAIRKGRAGSSSCACPTVGARRADGRDAYKAFCDSQ
jgi:hypothetical protein